MSICGFHPSGVPMFIALQHKTLLRRSKERTFAVIEILPLSAPSNGAAYWGQQNYKHRTPSGVKTPLTTNK